MQTISKFSIRRAQPADMDRLLYLLRILFSIEEDFRFDLKRQQAGIMMILAHKQGIILVAEYENRVIGMCSGQLMVSTAEGGLSLLVEDVIVDAPWRKQGIGSALLAALEDWAIHKQALRLQLLADRTNSDALQFYHTRRWRQTKLIGLCKRLSRRTQGNKEKQENA